MLISPTVNREYRFAVNGEEVALTVPGGGTSTEDFRYERVLVEMLAAQANRAVWTDGITRLQNRQAGGRRQTDLEMVFNGQRSRRQVFWVPTGRMVKQGEPIKAVSALIAERDDLGALVLAAAVEGGPGPLISHFAGAAAGSLPCLLIIVPAALDEDSLDRLA